MPSIQPPAQQQSNAPVAWPQYRVSTKAKWTDPWKVMPYLEAVKLTLSAGTTVSRATFRYRSGNVMREDKQTYSIVDLGVFDDLFVLVETLPAQGPSNNQAAVKPAVLWVGIFAADAGELGGAEASFPSDQDLTAYGLEHLLDLEAIHTAQVTNDGTTADQIGRALVFNEKYERGFNDVGNRSIEEILMDDEDDDDDGGPPPDDPEDDDDSPPAGPSCYVFADNSSLWSAYDIIQYLLANYGPQDIPVTIGGGGILKVLQAIKLPRVEQEGKTPKQVIDHLIDRRRGMGWCFRYSESTAGGGGSDDDSAIISVELYVFSLVGQAFSVDTLQVPGNPEAAAIDLGSHPPNIPARPDRPEVRLSKDVLSTYGRVIVEGEPIVSCFTVSFADGTLEKAWTSGEEATYLAGNGGTDAASNDRNRMALPMSRVFTTFRIPSAWGWKAGGGGGASGQQLRTASPYLDQDGTLNATGAAPVRNWGHILDRSLPIKKTTGIDKWEPEFLEPFVVLKDSNGKRVYAHAIDPTVPTGSAHIRPIDTDFGFEVRFGINHRLAKNHWASAAATGTDPTADGAGFDYTTMVATVAARTDSRVAVVATIPKGNIDRTLYIRVPGAEFWYLVPNTVTGVKQDGLLDYTPPAGMPAANVLRDDSAQLRQIAALAQAWYGQVRRSLTLKVKSLDLTFKVGGFVTNLVDGTRTLAINSPITEVEYDLHDLSTTVRTSFAQMELIEAEQDLPRLHN